MAMLLVVVVIVPLVSAMLIAQFVFLMIGIGVVALETKYDQRNFGLLSTVTKRSTVRHPTQLSLTQLDL